MRPRPTLALGILLAVASTAAAQPSPLLSLQSQAAFPDPNALFDGSHSHSSADGSVENSFQVTNGQLQSFNYKYTPWGMSLEGGYLGLDTDRNALIGLSPYLSAREDIQSTNASRLDYRVSAQVGSVDLAGRYFADSSTPDPAVDGLLSELAIFAAQHGVSPATVQQYLSYAQYQDPYQTDSIVVGSVLGQVGRAMDVYGPVDIGWAATGLMKVSYFFPNAALDAAAGPRFHLADGHTLSLYGGATENLSPISSNIIAQTLDNGVPSYGAMLETAPHAGFSYNGRLPTDRKMVVGLGASRQWNTFTTADQVRAGLYTVLMGRPVEFAAVGSQEKGAAVEYDSRALRGEVTAQVTPTASASVGVERQHIDFGDASVDDRTVYGQVHLRFGPGGHGRLDMTEQSGGHDRLTTQPMDEAGLDQALAASQAALAQASLVTDAAAELLKALQLQSASPAQTQASLSDLETAVQALPPATKQQFLGLLLTSNPTPAQARFVNDLFGGAPATLLATDLGTVQSQSPLPAQIQNFNPGVLLAQVSEIQQLLTTLSSDATLQALAVRLGRGEVINVLNDFSIKIPYVGAKLVLKPAMLLAAGQIFNSGNSPMLPLTAADEQNKLEPLLWKTLASNLSLPGNASQAAISQALVSQLTASLRAELTSQLEAQLQSLGSQTPQQAATQLLSVLPANIQASLQSQYGPNLSGLIPPGATTQQVAAAIINAATDATVQSQLAGIVGQGTQGIVQWIADTTRHELNQYMLQLFMASKELDRMTVDHGMRPSELSYGMLDRSFSQLDLRESRRPQADPAEWGSLLP